ncbi:MAG: NusG domain II-containing protein [Eubacteriales bacterium]|nr:NusG domain II-containing protein [Eubacteriales bacterium]
MKKTLLAAGILLALFAVLWLVGFLTDGGTVVRVYLDGALYATAKLDKPAVIRIERDGVLLNEVVIENGKAYVRTASCPDQICVHTAPITADGGSVICLPNRVVVKTGGAP